MARELSPGRVDRLAAAITGAERLAEASRSDSRSMDLEDAVKAVQEAIRRLDQVQELVLGVFLADPPARDPGDIAEVHNPDRLLAEWTDQELLHAEDPAPELWAEIRRRLADPEFRHYADAEVRKAVPAVRAAMGRTS